MYKAASIYSICLLLFFSVGVFSCYDENNTLGERLVESKLRNVYIDTSTVKVTAVMMDSIESSATGKVLLGQYNHPLWGKISASSYIPYNRPGYSTNREKTVVYDSLTLRLSYSTSFVGDTVFPQRWEVYRLTDKIVLHDNGYLYNTSTIPYDPEPLGGYTFRPLPLSEAEVEFRLDDRLGVELLNRLHNNDETMNSDVFEHFFSGILITPDTSISESLLSFEINDTSSVIVLHYHVQDDERTEVESLLIPDKSRQFTHFSHDRTGSLLANYSKEETEIPSEELANRGFMYAGLGWFSRLEFPYLNELTEYGQQIEIEQAVLEIYPDYTTYSDYNALPDSIYLYIADENNIVTDAVTDYMGDEVQIGTLYEDDLFPENTVFSFDITDFIKQEMGAIGKYKHNLQLVFSSTDYVTTFKNLTFYNKEGENPIKLKIVYTIYESY